MNLGIWYVEVNMLAATNGPQLGVYTFDYATQSWPTEPSKAQGRRDRPGYQGRN